VLQISKIHDLHFPFLGSIVPLETGVILMADGKFYTCKNDRAFKEVFLNERNGDLLKALLEKILKVDISEIDIRNIERNSENVNLRRKYLDCLLKTNIGSIGIEINSDATKDYVPFRNFAYLCDMYSSEVKKGEEYDSDIQFVQINFDYKIPEYEHDDIIKEYWMQTDKCKKFVDNVRIISLDMEMYKNMWLNKEEKAIEENKLLIMLDLQSEELLELSKKDRMVLEYMNELNRVNQDPEFRQYMTEEEDQEKIRNTEINAALKKGIEQGEKKKQIEVVKELAKRNMELKDISDITKLSIEEVTNILTNN
jgi:predicted transposase/invertase (TIGR01784 family)